MSTKSKVPEQFAKSHPKSVPDGPVVPDGPLCGARIRRLRARRVFLTMKHRTSAAGFLGEIKTRSAVRAGRAECARLRCAPESTRVDGPKEGF